MMLDANVTIQQIMTKNVVSVHSEMPLLEAARILNARNFDGLPVVDANNKLVGILTEYDLISKSSMIHLPTFQTILWNMPVFLLNNTIYANSQQGIYTETDSNAAVIGNNIAYGNGWGDVYNGGIGSVITFNLTGIDPKFVNAAGADFHLQSTSPAINAGTTISAVVTDIAGTVRPQGSAYDIGAYEFIQ